MRRASCARRKVRVMRTFAAALAVFLLSLPAGAEEAAGTVMAVYYEASRGVLLQWRARAGSGVRWADVDLGGRKVLARIPDGMRVSPGDRIAVLLGEPKSMPLAQALPTAAISRAVASDANASVGR